MRVALKLPSLHVPPFRLRRLAVFLLSRPFPVLMPCCPWWVICRVELDLTVVAVTHAAPLASDDDTYYTEALTPELRFSLGNVK